jgi:hypothetical protein
MSCKILKDKRTNEEFLVPDCYSVISNMWHTDMTDREIIKTYCSCGRKKVEKYEVHTRDEVMLLLDKLERKIEATKNSLRQMEEELDCIKSEVLMLNTVEVFCSKELPDDEPSVATDDE